MYSSTLSLTSSLDGMGGQRHDPAAIPPGKTRYPLCGRLGRPEGRSGSVRKISLPLGCDPQTLKACSESLYRLSYRGPYYMHTVSLMTLPFSLALQINEYSVP